MKRAMVCAAMICTAAGCAFGVGPMGAEMIPALPGGLNTTGYGVSDNGMVVGQADDLTGTQVAFAYFMGVTEALPMLPGGTEAAAYDCNDDHVVVGFCRDSMGVSRAVKWQQVNGAWTITDLGTLRTDGTGFGVAQRINATGTIVGYSTRADGSSYHGTIWSGGTTTDTGTLGFSGNFAYSQVLGVNQAGDVSGFAYATLQGPEHGLYLPSGSGRASDITPAAQFGLAQWHQVNDDGKLGGYISGPLTAGEFRPATWTDRGGFELAPLIDGLDGGYGYDLNNGSVLVGVMFHLEADPTLSVFRAFKSENGVTEDLNVVTQGLTGTMTEARGVTNTGLIVGTADIGFGVTSAVVLYPLPPACAGDIGSQGGVEGSDGVLDNNDFIVFIDWFFNQDPRADIGVQGGEPGSDHVLDNNDFIVFIDRFFAGCN